MMPDLTELERVLDGEVVPSGSPAFREVRRPFNALFDVEEPQAVVRCASEGDVAETIAFIRQRGLRCATRGGGHDFAGRSTTPGVLIDVSPMRSVTVADGAIRIGAGAVLGEPPSPAASRSPVAPAPRSGSRASPWVAASGSSGAPTG